MMQTLYLIVFAALGVGLFSALVRGTPNRAFFPMLGPGVVLLAIAGFGMLRLLPMDYASHPVRVFVVLGLLWACWIGLMAFIVQVISRRMPGTYPWPVIAGGVATLAPVIGFIAAKATV